MASLATSSARVTPPLQARSKRALDAILAAVEALLEERSFDRIGMAEIAARAGVAVGSIYARFADKQSLLIGMHDRIHELTAAHRQKLVDPVTWEHRDLDALLRGAIYVAIRYYRQHSRVLQAISENPPSELVVALGQQVARFKSAMADLIALKAGLSDKCALEPAVDAAVNTVVAVLMFSGSEVGQGAFRAASGHQLARHLLTIVRALLASALKDAPSPKVDR